MVKFRHYRKFDKFARKNEFFVPQKCEIKEEELKNAGRTI